MSTLQWDYTTLAATYDARPDYDRRLLDRVFDLHQLSQDAIVLDCGAGTGKLTKELIGRYTYVIASEPNETMRIKGMENVNKTGCSWIESPAENMDIKFNSVSSVWFGSSFNVVNHKKVFQEFSRYAKPKAWLTCLWNHRDLNDPLQRKVEEIVSSRIEGYEYGSRRKDPTLLLNKSQLFGNILKFESEFLVRTKVETYIEAWKSHATLRRQCKNQKHFSEIIEEISEIFREFEFIDVPYTTRLWTCRAIG